MTPPRSSPGLAVTLLLAGSCGFAAAWVLVALLLDSQCSWMALLAALDAAWLLRLGRMPAGTGRAVLALAATALVIALANWVIAAAQLGKMLGLLPWASALKLGPHHAWTLIQLANGTTDLALLGAALVLSVVASRWSSASALPHFNVRQ